ncbi:MAG TPA: Hsp20/alpha crystallin family protein [Opitutales bacterium]|nr:Hsp20/alpha crystallin family protein [Opitutales bacterium]
MRLIKYDNRSVNPFAELDRLFSEALLGGNRYGWERMFEPATGSLRVNLYHDDDALYVTAELPGVSKKDVSIQLENAVLTIRGERKMKEGKAESSVAFERAITVGEDINADKIKAKLEEGILTISLPKAEHRKPKAITVS